MDMLWENILERIQSAEEGTKRLYIIAGTIFAMTLIVTVWLAYFSPLGQVPQAPQVAAVGAIGEREGFSFWESVRGALGSIRDAVRGGRDYPIEPSP
jgi:hypothetical protein